MGSPAAGFLASLHTGYTELTLAMPDFLDAKGVDVVLAVPPPASGLGRAILDRLSRAAAPRPESD